MQYDYDLFTLEVYAYFDRQTTIIIVVIIVVVIVVIVIVVIVIVIIVIVIIVINLERESIVVGFAMRYCDVTIYY